MKKNKHEIREYKFIVIGDPKTGKSKFVNKWVKNIFTDDYNPTIVSQLNFKNFELEEKVFKIHLCDVSLKENNYMLEKKIAENINGIIILSDATNITTRESTKDWKEKLKNMKIFLDAGNLPYLLVESKCDLIEETPKYEEELKQFANDNEFIGSFSVSSKTGKNINESIEFILKYVIKRNEDNFKECHEEKEDEKDDSSFYDINKEDIYFSNVDDETLEIETKKDNKKYSYKMDIDKLKENYEILSYIKNTDKLVEALDELKERDKLKINYYLKDVVIQIGFFVNSLFGEPEEITFNLTCEDIEDEDLTNYLIKELKERKENKLNDKEKKSEEEEEKKSEDEEKNEEKKNK